MSKTVQFRLKWAQDFRGQQQKVAVHMTSACLILPTGHDGVYFLHAKMLTPVYTFTCMPRDWALGERDTEK
jgi:hypothetical protein